MPQECQQVTGGDKDHKNAEAIAPLESLRSLFGQPVFTRKNHV
ncbi:MAG: hypothetical protein WCA35_10190 [Kovacikia sp.]